MEAWYTSSLDIEEGSCSVLLILMFISLLLMSIKSFDTVDWGILDGVLSGLGSSWLVSSCLF